MAHALGLTGREAEIIRVLKLLATHRDRFVVVGGYAVNALTSHRFSVDCDLVVARNNVEIIKRILREEDYKRRKPTRRVRPSHAVRREEFIKLVGARSVSVDLFIDRLVCRQTAGKWTYGLLKRNSFESNVVGLTDSARAFVPKRELLIAMKVHAGRGADLRDLVMLGEGADWDLVSEFADTGMKEKMIGQIAYAVRTINTDEFSSALKAEFVFRADVAPMVKRSTEGLNLLKELISSQ